MENPISLNKIKMNVISTAKKGVVNAETIFKFTQEGSIVTAAYSGGKIHQGYLVGKISDNKLYFRYAQIDKSDNLDGGNSICDIQRSTEGKIQLIEHFKWESSEGSGINVFEEIKSN
jgi:hypothetical protein